MSDSVGPGGSHGQAGSDGASSKTMRVVEHFRELRRRLILAIAGVLLASVAGWFLYTPTVDFMSEPLAEIADTNAQLNFQTISAALDLRLKVSLWLGLLVSSPWWIYQAAAFIGPGLKRRERLHTIGFGLGGLILFAGGAYSGVLVAPRAVDILVSFVPEDGAALISAASYVNFYTYLVIAFGLSFLVPELLVAMNFAGLVRARSLVKGWRVAVIAAFALAAVINPIPSPLPMIIQALGMLALYCLAILVAYLHERRVAKRDRRDGDPADSARER
ncbi:MAG: twin-arginine translocase subunit TatC [Bifidobacteriaceae bacterium]|jgi:sec-independent protein translocase protein TatC|nr:twin-arginine translocase subunit TatC [Bifidobacteriaceae bacterium]